MNPLHATRMRIKWVWQNPPVLASESQYAFLGIKSLWVLPIFSGFSSLKDTVEVPLPPDLVVTIMSPLSFLAWPTRHTILLADIHSAVRRQLWPQIVKPGVKAHIQHIKNKQTNPPHFLFQQMSTAVPGRNETCWITTAPLHLPGLLSDT